MSSKRTPSNAVSAVLVVGIVVLVQAQSGYDSRGVIGLILGCLAALLYRARHRLQLLQEQVDTLEKKLAASARSGQEQPAERSAVKIEPAAAPVAAKPAPTVTAPAHAPVQQTPPPIPSAIVTVADHPAQSASTRPVVPNLPSAEPGALDRAVGAFVAWLKGGNPLARAGVVILFFGGAFLAKYAADHSLFPIELRMAAIAAATLALLAVGWRLRSAKPLYAQTLQGGGVAGFYLTVFASTRLYQLLPHQLALAMMIVVALAAAILAVAQNALALAVIGSGGGFLAPILLATGGGSLAALFTYYTVLNLGIFAVAWFRAWRVLNWVGFLFTFGIAGLFRATAYGPDQQPTMEFFLWLFYLLYFAVSVLFSIKQEPRLRGYVSASLVFGLPLAVFSLHASIVGHAGFALAWSALGLAIFYIGAAYVLLRSKVVNLRLLAEAFAALGVIFATLAIPLAFDRQSTAVAWAVEGSGLVWLAMRQQRALARWFGLALQLVAGISFLSGYHEHANVLPVLNAAFLGSSAIAIAGVLSGWWLWRSQAANAKGFDVIAALWGVAWWLGGGLDQIDRYAQGFNMAAVLGLGSFTVLVLYGLSRRMQWQLLWWTAVALVPGSAAVGLWLAVQAGHPFAEWAWAGWLPLLAACYWLLYRWQPQGAGEPAGGLAEGLHASGLWLLLLIAAWEGSWQTGQVIAGVWPSLPWGLVPAAALLWLSRRELLPAWPCARYENTYRLLASLPLAIGCVLWILLMNLSSDGDPIELIYLPVLNPLDLAVLASGFALLRYWMSLGAERRARVMPDDPRVLPGMAAALLFLWLNAALIRALHYLAGTPLTFDGIGDSILVQASMSILWAVLGFATIVIAARRARRDAWFVGAGLMAVLVAKLFLVDTAGRGTMARIASFLIAGLLLLVAGYVSPLPPRRAELSEQQA